MGQDKALIQVQGESLLQRQLVTIQTLGPAECFISGRAGVNYGAEGIPVLHDPLPGQGPMAGIARALGACRTPRLLVLAVDLIQMTPVWLEKLLAHSSDTCGCAPRMHKHWEPLAAVYPKSMLPRIQKHLSAGQLALQGLLDETFSDGQMESIEVAPNDKQLFTNLNTPEALNQFNHQP